MFDLMRYPAKTISIQVMPLYSVKIGETFLISVRLGNSSNPVTEGIIGLIFNTGCCWIFWVVHLMWYNWI